jgi:hypothetical protein
MGMQIVYFMLFQNFRSKHILKEDIVVEYDAFYTSNFTIYRNIDQNERKKNISNTFLFFVLLIYSLKYIFVVILTKTVNLKQKKFKINLIIPYKFFRYINF